MPRKKKNVEPIVEEPEIVVEEPEIIEEEPIIDIEKVKLQIFKDSTAQLVEQAPSVLAVKENPMLYGEFLYALKRNLT